jgi:hypothetical protein
MMELILGILAPLLMAGSITDLQCARLAAAEAIAAYNATGPNQLITTGQILAFAFTALDNLRLSMAPDLSLSMKLKLRGNANALNRSAAANTKLLEKARQDTRPEEPSIAERAATAQWEDMEPAHDTATDPRGGSPAAGRVPQAFVANAPCQPAGTQPACHQGEATPATPPPATTEQRNSLLWANAMKARAGKLRATVAHVPPAERKANLLWADVLTGVATDLALGKSPVAGPGTTRSELMRTTLMASGTTFPAHLVKRKKH